MNARHASFILLMININAAARLTEIRNDGGLKASYVASLEDFDPA